MVGLSMRDVEVRLVSELMKNSRRSDRELAKILGLSQPTVTRMRNRLESEGIIREYTVIPDFSKMGYQLVGFTLVKHTKPLNREKWKEIRRKTSELEKKNPHADILAVNGIGLQKDVLFVTFYENYSAYTKAMQLVKEVPFVELNGVESFLVDLNDKNHYKTLSMSALANHILTLKTG
jgi:DNA-binding Lrp family transcriptional regulator